MTKIDLYIIINFFQERSKITSKDSKPWIIYEFNIVTEIVYHDCITLYLAKTCTDPTTPIDRPAHANRKETKKSTLFRFPRCESRQIGYSFRHEYSAFLSLKIADHANEMFNFWTWTADKQLKMQKAIKNTKLGS